MVKILSNKKQTIIKLRRIDKKTRMILSEGKPRLRIIGLADIPEGEDLSFLGIADPPPKEIRNIQTEAGTLPKGISNIGTTIASVLAPFKFDSKDLDLLPKGSRPEFSIARRKDLDLEVKRSNAEMDEILNETEDRGSSPRFTIDGSVSPQDFDDRVLKQLGFRFDETEDEEDEDDEDTLDVD